MVLHRSFLALPSERRLHGAAARVMARCNYKRYGYFRRLKGGSDLNNHDSTGERY
jgi:hypothetical protein